MTPPKTTLPPPVDIPSAYQFVDRTGLTYGRLLVLYFAGRSKSRRALWVCRCSCGTEAVFDAHSIANGNTRSCGCLNNELRVERGRTQNVTHGNSRKGRRTREYISWASMKDRCLNERFREWKYWGGRGITIHLEWVVSFETFLRDMGPRPEGTSLDRINNEGNYEPGNCRWATPKEQVANQRKNEFCGYGHAMTPDNIKYHGIQRYCIQCRLRLEKNRKPRDWKADGIRRRERKRMALGDISK